MPRWHSRRNGGRLANSSRGPGRFGWSQTLAASCGTILAMACRSEIVQVTWVDSGPLTWDRASPGCRHKCAYDWHGICLPAQRQRARSATTFELTSQVSNNSVTLNAPMTARNLSPDMSAIRILGRAVSHWVFLFPVVFFTWPTASIGVFRLVETETPVELEVREEETALWSHVQQVHSRNARSRPVQTRARMLHGFGRATQRLANVDQCHRTGHRLSDNLMAPLRC